MKYIRLSIFFVAICFASVTFAQADKFEADIKKFIDLSNDSNWREVIDMMHPSTFTSVSKEQMTAMMNQMKALGIATNTELKSITKVHDAIKNDGSIYQKVDYDVIIKVSMSDQLWAQKDFLMAGIKGNFGGDNLKIDDTTKTITMDGVQSMIAIKDTGADWKYLTYQGDNDVTAKSVLPAAVLEKL